jgi:hypothetical protein
MIALGPRDLARAATLTLALGATLHILDRVIAGFARCPLEHCLLVNPALPATEGSPAT